MFSVSGPARQFAIRVSTVAALGIGLVHVVLGRAVGERVDALARLLTNRRAARLDEIGPTLGAGKVTALTGCAAPFRITGPRLRVLGLVCDFAHPAGAAVFNDGIRRALAPLECREALLIDVVGEDSEKVVESSGCGHVGVDTETAADVHSFDRRKIIHFIGDVLAVVKIVHGLTIGHPRRIGGRVLKGRYGLLGLKPPVADATTEIRGCVSQIKKVLIVITCICD